MVDKEKKSVIIVGAGPAGLFTAYKLCHEAGHDFDITVIDKGKDLAHRICPIRDGAKTCANCSPCNITHGFGGAGTFSDCKLSLSPFGVGGEIASYLGPEKALSYVQQVDNLFRMFGGAYNPENEASKIVYGYMDSAYSDIQRRLEKAGLHLTYNPTRHIGTDGTYKIMQGLYEYLVSRGVHFMFNMDCRGIHICSPDTANWSGKKKVICLPTYSSINETQLPIHLLADYIVFAPGRAGNVWLSSLMKNMNVNVTSAHFDLGFRVETPAEIVEKIADTLYDAKISCEYNGYKVRTFCMNPRGFVSEEHYSDGSVLANGHSYADKKSNNTNFVVLVSISDGSTNAVRSVIRNYCQKTDGRLTLRNVFDKPDIVTEPTLKTARTDKSLVYQVRGTDKNKEYYTDTAFKGVTELLRRLDGVCPGLYSEKTNLYGLEAKFYSDTIVVDSDFETSISGVYAIGDGAGITRGICQSAGSGLAVADSIIKKG